MAFPQHAPPFDLNNYTCSNKGLLLPIINEYTWDPTARAILYLCGLLYCFMGVALIADIFMCSIEKITSQTRKIVLSTPNDSEPEIIEVKVWNDTVANLTLMALGSSAPEILLSIIEIIGNRFHSGELGPGTIVGSAAFNLLIITAVCVVAIPEGETRRIKNIKVFGTTAFFSVFAYIWLIIILVVSTPNVVELWEAVLTLVFFPVCVLIAYIVDKDFCSPKDKEKDKQLELGMLPAQKEFFREGKLDRDALVQFIKEAKKYPGLSDEDVAVLAASKLIEQQKHSRLWYRIGAVRDITGGRKTTINMNKKLKEVFELINDQDNANANCISTSPSGSMIETIAVVEFHAATCAVMENIGTFNVQVRRRGCMTNTAKVKIESIDGSAVEGEDYVKISQMLTFEPGVSEIEIPVEIVNDNQWEPDEEFFIKLTLGEEEAQGVVLGRINIMEVTILNDDDAGMIQFKKRGLLVKESVGVALIPVVRKQGSDGEVTVSWRTIDKKAVNGKDFIGGEGMLAFKHGETELNLEIPIVNDLDPEKDEHFEVELYQPTGGARIGSANRTTVTITNDDDFNSVLQKMMMMTHANVDAIRVESETWASQFKDAMNVNGGNIEEAEFSDYMMHYLTFGWKVLFAFVPPPSLLGGWLCFFCSLSMIGFLTAIIGDLASIFGCLVGVPDSITAITFVAAGTSLPDLFASKTAAKQEKFADNAIGNVTGSNSVNVFLGLGLPWVVAAAYWFNKGQAFDVAAGSLSFSVMIYTIVSLLSIFILMARRFVPALGKAELGGPVGVKWASAVFLVSLWFVYIILSSLRAVGKIHW